MNSSRDGSEGIKRKEKLRLPLVVLLAQAFLYLTNCSLESAPVVIDIGSQPCQTFQGLGVGEGSGLNSIRPEQQAFVEQKLFRDLNITSFRIWLDVSVFAAKPGTRDYSYLQTDNYQPLGALRYGVRDILLTPTNPPQYMFDPKTHHISDDHLTEYTQCIADAIKALRDQYGVKVTVSGIGNEPGWLDNPSQPVVMVKSLRQQLDAYGLNNVKIIAPEGPSNDDYWAAYIYTLRSHPDAWNVLDGIANHSYWNTARPIEATAVADTDKEYWNTESGATFPASTLPLAATGVDMAARFLNDVDERMTHWMVFIGVSPAGEEAGHRVMLLNPGEKDFYTLIPTYWYMKQLSETFNPGAVFRGAFSSLDNTVMYRNLAAAAARNEDGSWGIALANRSGEPRGDALQTYDATVNIPELRDSGNIVFDMYQSGPDQNDAYVGQKTMENGSILITGIGQYQMVTLRSHPRQLDTGKATREIFQATSSVAETPSASIFQPVKSLAEKPLFGNFAARTRGYLVAPETGDYTFWIAGQGNAELWLSPDEELGHAIKIASTGNTGAARRWSASPSQKSANNSFQFNGGPNGVISLTAQKRYYFEVQEKPGSRDVAVAWARPGESTVIEDGDMEPPGPLGATTYTPPTSPVPDQAKGTTPGSATFVATDTTTMGNWPASYGADGYSIVDEQDAFPAYVNVSVHGMADDSNPQETTDPRGLFRGEDRTKRFYAQWRGQGLSIDLDFLDGNTHLFSLYSSSNDSHFKVNVFDTDSRKALDSQEMTVAPSGATYITWKLGGRVTLQFSGADKGQAAYSGMFFGAGPGRVDPPDLIQPIASSGKWTVTGCGKGIAGDFDQLRYNSMGASDDCSVVAKVASQSSRNAAAQAGIMIRETSGGSAPFASLSMSPGGNPVLLYRSTSGSQAQRAQSATVNGAGWLKLVRTGDLFNAFVSADGNDWTQVGDAITCKMNPAVRAGIFVTSGDNENANTATFTDVHVLRKDGSSGDWHNLDIGSPAVMGGASFDPAHGEWTLNGNGANSGGAVQGRLVATRIPQCNNEVLVARLDSVAGGSNQAFTSLGFRDSLDPASPLAEIQYFPNTGKVIRFAFGAKGGAASSTPSLSGANLPIWLKVVRRNFYGEEGYFSKDGKNWMDLGGTYETFTSIRPEGYLAAMFAQSQDTTSLTTATFSNLWFSSGNQAPEGWSTQDIGQRIIQGQDLAPYDNMTRGQAASALASVKTPGITDPDTILALQQSGSTPVEPQWASIDLGQNVDVTGLRIQWGDSFPASYQLMTSVDGIKWETSFETDSGRGGDEQVDLSHHLITARFVDLRMSRDSATNPPYAIKNFAILGAPENLASKSSITASSYLGSYQPFKIADGYASTMWACAADTDAQPWVQFDLGKKMCVNRIAIDWHANDLANSYSVAISDDPAFANSVKLFSTDSGAAGQSDNIGFSGIGRYVRLAMSRPNTTRYSISEITINGYAAEVKGMLSNGRFDNPILPPSQAAVAHPLAAGWDFTGDSGIQACDSSNAPPGDFYQCAYLQGSAAGIAQKFQTEPGDYAVDLLAAKGKGQGQSAKIVIDGTPVGDPISPVSNAFTKYSSAKLSLNDGEHEISFQGAGNSAGDGVLLANIVLHRLSPQPPADFVAGAVSSSSIILKWATASGDDPACQIERSTDGTKFDLVASLPGNPGTYTDTKLTPSTRYFYRVKLINSAGAAVGSIFDTTTLPEDGADLALGDGSNVTASSTDGHNKFMVDGLTDENGFSTDWWGARPHWVQVDLNRTALIDQVDLYASSDEKGFPMAFTIDVSVDGKTYSRACTVDDWPQPKDHTTPQTFKFKPMFARYVRVNAWKTGPVFQIGEEKVYAAKGLVAP